MSPVADPRIDTSWTAGRNNSAARPWWHQDGETVICALVLAVTFVAVVAALFAGQARQQAACERAAVTAAPCGVGR